ncbi:MFS transporter [Thermodesulfobacteriota bacterium]
MTLQRKLLFVSLLYFAEGFPFGLLEQTLPIYFRLHGMSLEHLGLLTIFSLPYALKFLWAPAVDFLGKRRYWIVAAQLLMAASILLMIDQDPANPSNFLWACIAALAIFSATQDIAIDAYSIELLDPPEMGIANGVRQAAYRVALVVAGGIFVALGGWIGWGSTYFVAAVILVVCAAVCLALPGVEVTRPKFSITTMLEPVRDFVTRPGVVQVTAFILLYKLGDLAIGPMVRPFWLERNLTTTEIGVVTGLIGVGVAIAGGLLGGLFTSRFGIFNGLWVLGIWQFMANLVYTWAAAYPSTGKLGVYAASMSESFCSGMGTAAFLAFLMSICKKESSATQYALLSALFRIAGIVAGTLSGIATEYMGYAHYFALTFFIPLPAFLFLPAVRKWIPVGAGSKDPKLIGTNGDQPAERGPQQKSQ